MRGRLSYSISMVAEPLNSPTGAIHFGLEIASCDCNITEQVAAAAKNVN